LSERHNIESMADDEQSEFVDLARELMPAEWSAPSLWSFRPGPLLASTRPRFLSPNLSPVEPNAT